MEKQPLSRRARYRAETQEEAKEIAFRQLAEGGIEAVSLMAIGKEMGISGPALYRYFANRDALLSELIVDAYSDLADTMTETARKVEQTSPEERLRTLARRFREWAKAQPQRYLLLYGTPLPGYSAPEQTVLLAQRILATFLEAISAIPLAKTAGFPEETKLDVQLAKLEITTNRGQKITGNLLRKGLVWWTRLHGLISLEVAGHFTSMGFDPALLFDLEIENLLKSEQV